MSRTSHCLQTRLCPRRHGGSRGRDELSNEVSCRHQVHLSLHFLVLLIDHSSLLPRTTLPPVHYLYYWFSRNCPISLSQTSHKNAELELFKTYFCINKNKQRKTIKVSFFNETPDRTISNNKTYGYSRFLKNKKLEIKLGVKRE